MSGGNDVRKALQPYVAGGSSAIFASVCVQPLDLTKTRLQLSPAGTTLLGVMRGIVASEGVVGLYAGVSASVMRQAVYGTARLGLHREFSDRLKAAQGGAALSVLQSSGSAMLAGALASIIGTPCDVALVRMQADSMRPPAERRGYSGVFNALARIAREEGVKRLWQGFEPTAARAIAMNVGMMASYDQVKMAITKARRAARRTTRARAPPHRNAPTRRPRRVSAASLTRPIPVRTRALPSPSCAGQWRQSDDDAELVGARRVVRGRHVAAVRHDEDAAAEHEA
jgi:hypothetical protein